MQSFDLMADLDGVTQELVRAIAHAAGTMDIAVLSTWNGCDKVSWDLPGEMERTAEVNVEWLLRSGRFRLDLRVWGRGIPDTRTEARFARDVARTLGRPLLFSDCHLFPWSYILARQDGAILHVLVRPNEGDSFDLMPETPAFEGDTDFFAPELLYASGDPLDDAGTQIPERSLPPEYCRIFNGPCPKSLKCARTISTP